MDFWGNVGLLHDLDFEQWPEEHCAKVQELMQERDIDERMIHAVFLDFYSLQHLAYNNLHMLIADFYTLQAVNSLYLLNHVVLYASQTLDFQNIVRVYATFGDFVTGFD